MCFQYFSNAQENELLQECVLRFNRKKKKKNDKQRW